MSENHAWLTNKHPRFQCQNTTSGSCNLPNGSLLCSLLEKCFSFIDPALNLAKTKHFVTFRLFNPLFCGPIRDPVWFQSVPSWTTPLSFHSVLFFSHFRHVFPLPDFPPCPSITFLPTISTRKLYTNDTIEKGHLVQSAFCCPARAMFHFPRVVRNSYVRRRNKPSIAPYFLFSRLPQIDETISCHAAEMTELRQQVHPIPKPQNTANPIVLQTTLSLPPSVRVHIPLPLCAGHRCVTGEESAIFEPFPSSRFSHGFIFFLIVVCRLFWPWALHDFSPSYFFGGGVAFFRRTHSVGPAVSCGASTFSSSKITQNTGMWHRRRTRQGNIQTNFSLTFATTQDSLFKEMFGCLARERFLSRDPISLRMFFVCCIVLYACMHI